MSRNFIISSKGPSPKYAWFCYPIGCQYDTVIPSTDWTIKKLQHGSLGHRTRPSPFTVMGDAEPVSLSLDLDWFGDDLWSWASCRLTMCYLNHSWKHYVYCFNRCFIPSFLFLSSIHLTTFQQPIKINKMYFPTCVTSERVYRGVVRVWLSRLFVRVASMYMIFRLLYLKIHR